MNRQRKTGVRVKVKEKERGVFREGMMRREYGREIERERKREKERCILLTIMNGVFFFAVTPHEAGVFPR